MIGLIQRVSHACVSVDGKASGSINKGLLLLLGIEKTDTSLNADKLLSKVLGYRVFEDTDGKMNLSLRDTGGGLLIVSQFTLVADTAKGLRPSFSSGAPPEIGKKLYDYFLLRANELHQTVASGVYGADMQVTLCNSGPATFWLAG